LELGLYLVFEGVVAEYEFLASGFADVIEFILGE
jgi:hypothetical protein